MKWKLSKDSTKDSTVDKKQSISSTGSMSFLRDDNLTFHRFATDMSSVNSSRRPSDDNILNIDNNNMNINDNNLITANLQSQRNQNKMSPLAMAPQEMQPTPLSQPPTPPTPPPPPQTEQQLQTPQIWSTINSKNTQLLQTPSIRSNKNDYGIITSTSNESSNALNRDFQYTTNGSNKSLQQTTNGSTSKLIPPDDQSSKQSKSSIFRGIILCLCLNLTYSNVIRFPRELDRHGSAFLIAYFIILLVIGLPIVLLEISLGQFLGQGSAHSWKASPIFKGASLIGRLASWLGAIWISLQSVIAIVYIGELIFKSVPFTQCTNIRRDETGYFAEGKSGQQCLQNTFLTSVWEDPLYFLLLLLGLIVIWLIAMICTYNSKTIRRTIFSLGLCALILLVFQIAWAMSTESSITSGSIAFFNVWPFHKEQFGDSLIWFNALVQVIFSTNIGIGVLPVITGKFLYKGDAVRTSFIYIFFNILVTALSVTFFLSPYMSAIAVMSPQSSQLNVTTTAATNITNVNITESIPSITTTTLTTTNLISNLAELKPLTAIYDNAVQNASDPLLSRLIPGLSYLIVVLVGILTVALYIYTSSRLFRRHPNYIMSISGLAIAILSLFGPEYIISRILDSRIVGTLIICALIGDIISITWCYGVKNIYTDLEFSIGRPILRAWMILWCFVPIALTGILLWWTITSLVANDPEELAILYVPRWAPICFGLFVICVFACIEVYKQIGYNCCSMVQEAAKPTKDWGPADPIVSHSWKQWRSVCEDTGQKDFTLRRRGTRDYTHSIKRGQYSRGKFDATTTNVIRRKTSTIGSNSPNYSGSIFGDSAIEEDMSVEKYSDYHPHHHHQGNNNHNNHAIDNDDHNNKNNININNNNNDHRQQQQQQLFVYDDNVMRYSNGSRNTTQSKASTIDQQSSIASNGTIIHPHKNELQQRSAMPQDNNNRHLYYIHPATEQNYNVSKIKITPPIVTQSSSKPSTSSSSSSSSSSSPSSSAAGLSYTGGAASAINSVQLNNRVSLNPMANTSSSNFNNNSKLDKNIFVNYHNHHHHHHQLIQPDYSASLKRSSSGGSNSGSSSGAAGLLRDGNNNNNNYNKSNSNNSNGNTGGDHICWKKFSINSEEYSTEL